jgi:hypothetical protein
MRGRRASASVPSERVLCERVAATGEARRKPRERPGRSPDDRGANFHWPARESVRYRERAEKHAIVAGAEQAGGDLQCEAQKIVAERWIGDGGHDKVGRRPREEPGHHDRAARSFERGNGVTSFELSDEFLQYEGGPRERSIKRGGKTGARARCKQRPAVGRIPAKGFSLPSDAVQLCCH